jgi:hypothetical protein
MWRSNYYLEDTLLKEKLAGDLGNEPDGTPTSDNCIFGLLAKNESSGIQGLLQQYLPRTDIPVMVRLRSRLENQASSRVRA